MTERTLPPPCPNCSAKTTFKEMHKSSKSDGFMCFFWCEPCQLEYPLAVGSAEAALAGLKKAARGLPGKLSDNLPDILPDILPDLDPRG